MRSAIFSLLPTSSVSIGTSSAVPGSSTPAGATEYPIFTSSAINIERYTHLSVHTVITGAQPQGFAQLIASNDEVRQFPQQQPQYFMPIAGSSTNFGRGLPGSSAATGTSAMLMWNVTDANYKWLRLQVIASTASTGQLIEAQALIKGWE